MYQSFADVTQMVAAAGAGTWDVSNAPFATGPGAFGGWALVVVTEDPAASVGAVAVLDGFGPTDSDLSISLPGATVGASTFSVVAWDGDAGTTGDVVKYGGAELTPAGGLQDHGNAFDSTVTGSLTANSFGVDGKRFAVLTTSAHGDVTVGSPDDDVVIGVFTVETR